jgi:hypothetical protein
VSESGIDHQARAVDVDDPQQVALSGLEVPALDTKLQVQYFTVWLLNWRIE